MAATFWANKEVIHPTTIHTPFIVHFAGRGARSVTLKCCITVGNCTISLSDSGNLEHVYININEGLEPSLEKFITPVEQKLDICDCIYQFFTVLFLVYIFPGIWDVERRDNLLKT